MAYRGEGQYAQSFSFVDPIFELSEDNKERFSHGYS